MPVIFGDCRDSMRGLVADGVKVQTCVTSPPYWNLRDYGHPGQLGLEPTIDEYLSNMVDVFSLVWDLLADDGTLWINMGDSYAGSWGAQGRPQGKTGQMEGRSVCSARQIEAHPKHGSKTGSIERTGLPAKNLIGMPWRLAFALQEAGWILRQDIIWSKPNPMPESVTDRCTKSHEYIFLLTKQKKYYFDQDSISEPIAASSIDRLSQDIDCQNGSDRVSGKTNGNMKAVRKSGNKARKERPSSPESHNGAQAGSVPWEGSMRNKRSVWTIATQPFSGAHFATFPPALIEPCILAGSKSGDIVLDPFFGSGTTGEVAQNLGREWIGLEINEEYEILQKQRTSQMGMEL